MEKDFTKVFPDASTPLEDQPDGFSFSRRSFLQVLGSGLLITVTEPLAHGQGLGGTAEPRVAARLYLNEDGTITALSGKVEEGQGPRTELAQAAAEELRVSIDRIRMIMSDTELVPDDGITAGSRTTPSNVPVMRQAAATARELLTQHAAKQWQVDPGTLVVQDGVITNKTTRQTMTYADLAKSKEIVAAFATSIRPDVGLTPVGEWKTLGRSFPKLGGRDVVTGKHQYPSDIVRPNMLYGKVLRAPAYGATLQSIDLSAAEAMKDVIIIRDGGFVGFAAPSSHRAAQAMAAVAKTASWKPGRADEGPTSAMRRVFETNVFGYIYGARAVIPQFRNQGGGILINVASMVGKVGIAYMSTYVASKHALIGFAECLRQEMLIDGSNVEICTVMPASIDTPLFQHAANYSGREARPIPPIYDAEQVAEAIVRCVEKPEKEVYVGNMGRVTAFNRMLAPWLHDQMASSLAENQQMQDRPKPPTDGNLFRPQDPDTIEGGWKQPWSTGRKVAVGALAMAVPVSLVLGAAKDVGSSTN